MNRSWLLPVFAGAAAAAIGLPILSFGFTFDQGVFSTMADAMLHGGVTYRDAWEHKPPGVFYAYFLAFACLAREIWAVRVAELLMLGLSSAGLCLLAERRCGSRTAGTVAAIALPLLYLHFGPNTAQAESFQIPFLIGAWLVWPGKGDGVAAARRCFGSGILTGAAVMFKTPIVLAAGPLLIERLWFDRCRNGTDRFRLTVVTAVGVALPSLLTFGYYGARGAGPLFYDALIVYPALYASVGLNRSVIDHARESVGWVEWIAPATAQILILVGVLRGTKVRPGETLRWVLLFLATGGSVVIQGRYFRYHHLPMLPVLAWGMGLPFSRRPEGGEPASPVSAAALAALGIGAAVHFGAWIWPMERGPRTPATFDQANVVNPGEDEYWRGQRRAAREIRVRTRPDDRIFVWGDEPLLYPMADRRMAGRHPHLMQVVPPWGGTDRLMSLIHQLSRARPALIVVCPDQLWWRNNQSPKELLRLFPDMQQFLEDYYRRADAFGGYELWVRID